MTVQIFVWELSICGHLCQPKLLTFSSFAHHYQHLLLPHWNSAWYSDTGRFLAQSVRLVPPLPSPCQAFILSHEAGTRQTNRYFPACVSSENQLLRRIVLAVNCAVCWGICQLTCMFQWFAYFVSVRGDSKEPSLHAAACGLLWLNDFSLNWF